MIDGPRSDERQPAGAEGRQPADSDPSDAPTRTAGFTIEAPALAGAWGDLRIVEEIGRGAYGRVYRAWDEALAREVAVKIIRIDSSNPGAAATVLHEGRMLARVRHPNVVTVFGAQQVQNDIGLTMELVRGRPLAHMIRTDGPLGAEEAAVIGIRLCDALAAVHGAGLLHRDVKAQNVMRESGGRIVLMDFGAGRDVAGVPGGWKDMAGTPLYMAPEVLGGGSWSMAADVYSLGVLVFFLVTGRYPVEGSSVADIILAHGLGQQRLLADCRPGLPEGFISVVERALAPDPQKRYRSAGAMMRDLTEAVPGAAGFRRDGAASMPVSTPSIPETAERTPIVAAASPKPAVTKWAAPIVGAITGAWLLGFLTSMGYDLSLGRERGFANESALDWLGFGIRALVGPALYMVLGLLVYRVLRAAWRICVRLVRPLRNAMVELRRHVRSIAARTGLDNRATKAQCLVGAQMLAIAATGWLFRDLISACFTFLSGAPVDALNALRPEHNDAPVLYRATLSILLLVTAVGWYRLLKAGSTAAPIDRATIVAGLALLAVTILMLDVPFRILYLNSAERVEFGGERCYITGQHVSELLLFCPDAAPPRNRIVTAADARLHRTTVVESMFTSAPAGR